MQEEIRWSTRDGSSSKDDDEEDFSLASKELQQILRLCQWMGETTGMGATLVGSCAGGDKGEYQGWLFIEEL